MASKSRGGWVSANNEGGFLLLETRDVAGLLEFSAKFKELNETIHVTPVVELTEGIAIAKHAYGWVDSVR